MPAASPSPALTIAYNDREQTTSMTPSGQSSLTATYLGHGQFQRTGFAGDAFLNDALGIGRWTSGSQTTDFTRSPDGSDLSETVNNTHYYYAFDGLGSVVGLFDGSGNVVSNYVAHYEPYGKLITATPSGYPAMPIRFAGYWYDSQTRLYKVGARYYDPTTGRWTQRDPIDNPYELHGWNRYIYAGDDPINEIDPSGLCGISSWGSFGDCLHKAAKVSGVIGGYCGAGAMMTGGTVEVLDACALVADSVSAVASVGEAATLHGARRRRAAIAGSLTAICDFSIKARPIFGRACATAAGIFALKNG
jgi:RHS repeat-associated protein